MSECARALGEGQEERSPFTKLAAHLGLQKSWQTKKKKKRKKGQEKLDSVRARANTRTPSDFRLCAQEFLISLIRVRRSCIYYRVLTDVLSVCSTRARAQARRRERTHRSLLCASPVQKKAFLLYKILQENQRESVCGGFLQQQQQTLRTNM